MSRYRMPVSMPMAVVLLAAVALAALRRPSPVLASAAFALALLALLAGTTAALVGRGPFWVGFAVFGWGWAALSFGPWSVTPVPEPVTTPLLAEAFVRFGPVGEEEEILGSAATTVRVPMLGKPPLRSIPIAYLQTLQSVLAALLGCFGGLLAQAVAGRRGHRLQDGSTRGPSA